ncbi:MAG: hypothetical protein GY749_50030 [Desulfobacteraceae bacterium]|nr:hypothetical protein [Desulfobacteraceae bacterium]
MPAELSKVPPEFSRQSSISLTEILAGESLFNARIGISLNRLSLLRSDFGYPGMPTQNLFFCLAIRWQDNVN